MKITIATLLLAMSFTTFAQTQWLDYFKQFTSLSDAYTDYHQGVKNWKKNSNYGSSLTTVTPNNNSRFANSLCGNTFYPAHPLATTKEYHEALYKRLDLSKMTGEDHYCQIPGYKKRRCARALNFHFVIISDTFYDRCGNYFRGYWSRAYHGADESMGTT